MMTDEVIYEADGVRITRTLAKFGDASFPINGIGSVYVRRPTFWEWYKSVLSVTFLSVIVFVAGEINKWSWARYVAGGFALLGLAGSFMLPSKLMIRIASGDQKAFENTDRAKLNALKAAIEKAVTLRG